MNNHPNHAPATRNLQRYLRQLSFDEENIPPSPIDGIFEQRTEDALRAFQRLRGLPITGIADPETWERLFADYRISLALNSPARRIAIFPPDPPSFVLVPGSTGFAVLALQYMLLELHRDHAELAEVALTGTFDDKTAAAVRVFQERNRLPVDGTVGLLTWNAIADHYNMQFLLNGDE